MRVCFVSPEVFAWGYHGGFGFLTRTLGRELARRGVETCVVTVRRGEQGEQEALDGFTVLGYPPHTGRSRPFGSLLSKIDSVEYYRKADCDIYHSQAVSYNTLAAQGAMPGRFHLVTFQDPYDMDEWSKISRVNPRYRMTPAFRARLMAEVRLLSRACRRADGLYSQARFLIDKATRLYGLDRPPVYLPNPVEVPHRPMGKSGDPKVCFLARWDPQKRVDLFFELARGFPEVEFVAMGRSHDPETDNHLRKKYSGLSNVSLPGFVSEKEKSQILEESWALLNTSVREALPISFLEALAHETPIISSLDPDGLTSRFGYLAAGDNYAEGLRRMLADEGRREKGMRGRMYVEEEHELGSVVDRHLEIYKAHLEGRR